MNTRLKSSQRGVSFLGLIFVGGVLAVTGVIAAQVVPTVIEYQAVIKAAQRAAEGGSVQEVRALFQKSADVDNIKSISGKDIEVAKAGDRYVVTFAYQREIHLAGPGYLTMKYAGKSQ
jgi:hypothetical protein